MAGYMTTQEVARYLRLNTKKIYDLVARNQLPAARISGKWLFSKDLIDQWIAQKTYYPATGLMATVLDQLLVVQGSDDWLFSHVAQGFRDAVEVPVVSTAVGSLAGLAALASGRAHLAGCHVDNTQVENAISGHICYLMTLFHRCQGLIFDRDRHPHVTALRDLSAGELRFAQRQCLSGTYRLGRRLLKEAGIDAQAFTTTGPFTSHLEVALAIRQGRADVGIGTQLAAEMCGLAFIGLATEPFKLAVPLTLAGHPHMAAFLAFIERGMEREACRGVSGYDFAPLGRLETVGSDAEKQ